MSRSRPPFRLTASRRFGAIPTMSISSTPTLRRHLATPGASHDPTPRRGASSWNRSLIPLLALWSALPTWTAAAEALWIVPANVAEQGAAWTGPWRWHAGDDPVWARPDFDDSSWPAGDSLTVPLGWHDGTWPGRGWFRVRLDLRDVSTSQQAFLSVLPAGAAEVYFDGHRVLRAGEFGKGAEAERAVLRNPSPAIVTLHAGRTHQLAVRYANSSAVALNRIQSDAGGFVLRLDPPAEWLRQSLEWQGHLRGSMMFFTAVPLLLAVIHLALFLFLPRSWENLHCALFMGALSLLCLTRLQRDTVESVADYLTCHRLFLAAIVAFSLFGLLAIYTTFQRRNPVLFAAMLAVGLGLLGWSIVQPDGRAFQACAAFGFLTSVEIVRVAFGAVCEGREGARLVFAGMIVFGLAVIYNALRVYGVVPEQGFSRHTLNLGILAAAMAMSLFVSRSYARTTLQLERKLREVEELSAQNLQKEIEKQALISAQKDRLEIEVRDRTRELREEKEKSDQLLANILPIEIAQELKEHGTSRPRRHEEVTILFSDFKGFTTTTAAMPAHRLVEELNDLFRQFDDIAGREGIEKIKTIGDAYMAAAGLPEVQPDHAVRAVRAALAMVQCVHQRNAGSSVKWQIRVGLHSGPVVAGVVGKR
ncbi:MAG: hypothetical protein FJ399_11590, partial [Verrucomicrobia bacterium]|nr:hypothetical protein [Verrucomicrobiota bacterium]